MKLGKVNIGDALSRIDDYWSPRIGGTINDFQLKLVKLQGEFHWHHHDVEDELFLVVQGRLLMKLEADNGGDIVIEPGEFLVVPHGVRHCPVALTDEVHLMLLEPATTVNTGEVVNERTVRELKSI